MGASRFFGKRSPLKTANDQVTTASQLTLKQSLFPLALVTSLFFLWGFSYGLLDTLNKHFQLTLHITRTRSSGLQAAYFGAYPLASLGYSGWMLRHWGYKPVFIFGLCVYAIGAFMMWPATVYRSFGGFCGATFLCGSGLGSLETAANPYLAVCGPPRYSEIRINFAQSFNGIGTVVAPALASYVFFKDTADNTHSLKTVQWVYLAVGIFAFSLAFLFFISHIPEVTDADMELQVQETHVEGSEKSFWKQYRLFHAAFAQFCYVGGQVAIATWFINYCIETRPGSTPAFAAKLLAGAQAGFTVGRFSGTFLMHYIKPRKVFLVYLAMVVVFLAASCGARGNAGVSMLYLTLFFESICFPTIVALGIRGLGRHYKRGSGFIVGGVIGGGCVPALTGKVADIYNNTGIAMVVPMAFMVAALTYPICVNFLPRYKIPADALGSSAIGTSGNDLEKNDADVDDEAQVAKTREGAQVMEIEKR